MIRTLKDGILAVGVMCGALWCLIILETGWVLLEGVGTMRWTLVAGELASLTFLWCWLVGTLLYAPGRVRRWWMGLASVLHLYIGAGFLAGGVPTRTAVPSYAWAVFLAWSLLWWLQRHRMDPGRLRATHGL